MVIGLEGAMSRCQAFMRKHPGSMVTTADCHMLDVYFVYFYFLKLIDRKIILLCISNNKHIKNIFSSASESLYELFNCHRISGGLVIC